MQHGGKPERVKLKVNLERYGRGLVEGVEGWTIPDTKLSIWGDQDRFVAVNFDNGLKLDIIYSSLEKIEQITTQSTKSSKKKKEKVSYKVERTTQ